MAQEETMELGGFKNFEFEFEFGGFVKKQMGCVSDGSSEGTIIKKTAGLLKVELLVTSEAHELLAEPNNTLGVTNDQGCRRNLE
jgi:hypothetical protein